MRLHLFYKRLFGSSTSSSSPSSSSSSMKESEGWKDRIIALILLATGIVTTAYFLVAFVRMLSETYVWPIVTVGDLVQPVSRKTCSLPPPSTGDLKPISSKRKIGVLMIYDNVHNYWNNEITEKVIQNRQKYCDLHGFELINGHDQVDHSRPPAWSKLKAMDHYLHDYDYLVYIDMDVVIMNFHHNINDYIDLNPDKDFILTEDWSGVNTGVWIAKNTLFTHWFLQTAWNQSQLLSDYSPAGIRYPFEYEQRAFHYLLQTSLWQQRRLETYKGGNSNELRDHFLTLPQCSMNSYIMNPFSWEGNRETSHYVEGDFLVHFAGKKRKVKNNLMNYFLDLAR